MTGREIGREDALLMLDKWRSERASLLCVVDSRLGTFRKIGRIFGQAEGGLVLRSDGAATDGLDDFVVLLQPDARFAYDEPRNTPALARASASILLMFDDRSEDAKITFLELIEPS
jgi:hypothetical protein